MANQTDVEGAAVLRCALRGTARRSLALAQAIAEGLPEARAEAIYELADQIEAERRTPEWAINEAAGSAVIYAQAGRL